MKTFKWIGFPLIGLIISISLFSCKSGSSGNGGGGGAPGPQASASMALNGNSVVFTNPDGTVAYTIQLQDQTTSSFSLTEGVNITTIIRKNAVISDDGSHVGVITLDTEFGPTDSEAGASSSFTYYDASGQLWTKNAPDDTFYYLPDRPNLRLISQNGSQVLLVNSEEGNTYPVATLFDNNGNIINTFQPIYYDFMGNREYSPAPIVQFYEAQLSPYGPYYLLVGIQNSNGNEIGIVRVTYVTYVSTLVYDFPFDLSVGARPEITAAGAGKFQISFQNSQIVLPP